MKYYIYNMKYYKEIFIANKKMNNENNVKCKFDNAKLQQIICLRYHTNKY